MKVCHRHDYSMWLLFPLIIFLLFFSPPKVPERFFLDGVINDIMPSVARPLEQNKRDKSLPGLKLEKQLGMTPFRPLRSFSQEVPPNLVGDRAACVTGLSISSIRSTLSRSSDTRCRATSLKLLK